MIVYVRLGTLVRCVVCAVVLAIAVTTALARPAQHEHPQSTDDRPTTSAAQ